MQIKRLKLIDLLVNKSNDRHGELLSEDAAIEWLLTHRAAHMRNLAKDIVNTKEIFEPPLVHKEDEKYVVYDGNRRTSILKLLHQPQRAPSRDWADFFSSLRQKWEGKFPEEIECQVENDRERLDEILYRRHTGQQSGVGQSQWDAEAKSNFEKRTGKNTKINVAEEIEKLLRDESRLDSNKKLPRSNLNRLLSAEQFRNRVGIAVENNKLKLTHEREKVLDALEKIANDLISKCKTLDDIWDNEAKRAYLNDLERQKLLPTADDALPSNIVASSTSPPKSAPSASSGGFPQATSAEKRRTLIRPLDFGVALTTENRRLLDILTELQHRLKFDEHDNAIAVLFRVLLELSIELCIQKRGVQNIQKGDKLSNKFSKVLEHMEASGLLDKKYSDSIKKFEKSEPLLSANTLHAYVHNADFFPSDHHLKSMWDTLEKFVVVCLKS